MRSHLYSFLYKYIREQIKQTQFRRQLEQQQPQDLESVIEQGHYLLSKIRTIPYMTKALTFSIPQDCGVSVYDLSFPTPLIFSSYEGYLPMLELFCDIGIGGGTLKTMMAYERSGNPRPRIQEIENKGLINAMGLPGVGIDKMADNLKKSRLISLNRPIGLSIGGESISEYKDSFLRYYQQCDHLVFPKYYEVNISCPNIKEGHDLSKELDLCNDLILFMRNHTDNVISIKLSPMQENNILKESAAMISQHQKMVINVGNTQFKTCKEVGLSQESISIGGGGLSGPRLFERTCEMVESLSSYNVPIIATGGISTPENVIEIIDKGASLVGLATALVMDPFVIVAMNKALEKKINAKR